ncbi:MAG: phosphotransferase family protein [Gammaproteobacteria bacterium]|nr:phosphotransferase family protein [Gammaproteobacteria bacterium]MDE0364944.1 phosphotransferase family protein [Gammaproteobacteria bacterium]
MSVEGINEERVTEWLTARLEDLEPPLAFSLIAGGHSNLTYRFTDQAGSAWVLRRPPLGHVLQSAHDMGREHKIIFGLRDSDVPVPEAIALCRDTGVNDAPFYVMAFVAGDVLHDAGAAGRLGEDQRFAIGMHAVDVLARLHNLEPDTVGLGDLGRREAYLARQLKRWKRQWEASKTHEIPEMEETARILEERMPGQIGSAIVHGDYRLGNMIVGGGRVRAVLDWELCTLGDPLADVGYLLNSWIAPGEADAQATTAAGGFPSRAAISERYERMTGRDLGGIGYYRAFSHWRLAAIGQGVYKRYLVGAMGKRSDFDLESYKSSVSVRAGTALELLSGGD